MPSPRFAFVFVPCLASSALLATEPSTLQIPENVGALMQRYCLDCHSDESEKGDVNLQHLERPGHHLDLLKTMDWVLSEEEMPPRKAKHQPTEDERAELVEWVQKTIAKEKKLFAGDPGIVAMPRLNPVEYDNVIRDITGHSIGIGQFLGSEGAAGEGFTNVGAAQPFSSVHLENYLAAAKKLLTYARITPQSGYVWFANAQGEESDPDSVREQLWSNWKTWHQSIQNAGVKEQLEALKKVEGLGWHAYLEAAWRYRHRAALGMPNATVADIALSYDVPLFPSALQRMLNILEPDDTASGLAANPYMKSLAQAWQGLPPPKGGSATYARKKIKAMGKWHEGQVADVFFGGYAFTPIELKPEGPFKLYSARIADAVWEFTIDLSLVSGGYVYLSVADSGNGSKDDFMIWQKGQFVFSDENKPWQTEKIEAVSGLPVEWGKRSGVGGKLSEDAIGVAAPSVVKLKIPVGATRLTVQAVADMERGENATVQPIITDSPPTELGLIPRRPMLGQKVLPRAAALHRQRQTAGRFQSVAENQITLSAKSLLSGIPQDVRKSLEGFSQKGLRGPEERGNLFAITTDEIVGLASKEALKNRDHISTLFSQLANPAQRAMADYLRANGDNDAYEGKLPPSASPLAKTAEFTKLKAAYDLERATEDANASTQLTTFASQAWRRPPTAEETKTLTTIFSKDRSLGLSYEAAMKHASLAVLISPHFLFRPFTSQGVAGAHNISPYELASRLSFFLWASAPDSELLACAADGSITKPEVLIAQTRRMLSNERARAMATEFAGQWLTFVAFDKNTTPDAQKFPEFTPTLRQAMYEETNLFILDLLRSNLSMRNLINADYTFLNEELAKHYGIDGVSGSKMRKVNVPDDRRGGILTHASVLIKHSSPLRTSPVKRGVWVYQNLMGVKIPEPPPVPLLSDDEKNEAGLNIAEQLALHRANPSCSSCHDRFDPLGLALENYDPVGRWRTKDGAGSPVVNHGSFANGSTVESIAGLRDYLNSREDQIYRQFCRMLLAYAVGRSLGFTDEPLIDDMLAAMKKDGGRPLAALDLVVTSPQFTQRRDETAPTPVAVKN